LSITPFEADNSVCFFRKVIGGNGWKKQKNDEYFLRPSRAQVLYCVETAGKTDDKPKKNSVSGVVGPLPGSKDTIG